MSTSNPKRKATPGIRERHSRSCPSSDGGRCSCRPSIEAAVYSAKDGKKIRKVFIGDGALKAAKDWRNERLVLLNRGALRAPVKRTLTEEAELWQRRAEAGETFTRAGRPYKPAVCRGVESDFRLHIAPDLGSARLSEIKRRDIQVLVDRLRADGVSGSKIRGIVTSLKIVLRRALEDDEVTVDPTTRLRLPPAAGTRDRVVTAEQAAELIAVLPVDLQPLYATATYAGARRGELRGLRWSDVDLANGVIHISRGMDDKAGVIAPKSTRGVRDIPIAPVLRDHLVALKARTGREGDAYVFGSTPTHPFTATNIRRRANAAWAKENERRETENKKREENERDDPLVAIGLHELRHSWVSLMSDAGFKLEEIGDYAGHSSVWMTSRYRHLLPGATTEAARRFGDYLDRANTLNRLAQIGEEPEENGAQTGAHDPEEALLSQKS